MNKALELARQKMAKAAQELARAEAGPRARKPQINVELTPEEKELFERTAAKRGVKTAALIRLLVHDEARRLGIE